MSIRKQTAVRHISWEELSDMCNSIAGQLRFGPTVYGICPIDARSTIPAFMIAHKLGVHMVQSGGVLFGITSERRPEACFFHLEHQSEHFTSPTKYRIETLEIDIEGEFQKVTMPWEK